MAIRIQPSPKRVIGYTMMAERRGRELMRV
jgi:hypothetical protein